MNVRGVTGLIAAALLSSSAYATSLVGTTTFPTGIDGLVVDGVTYDVAFTLSDPISPWPYLSPEGRDVAIALATALNDFGVTALLGTPGYGQYFVWIDNGPSFDTTEGDAVVFNASTTGSGTWINSFVTNQSASTTGCFNAPFTISHCLQGATFTQVSVPEPATLSLLGIGLAGIGLMRRRKAV